MNDVQVTKGLLQLSTNISQLQQRGQDNETLYTTITIVHKETLAVGVVKPWNSIQRN